MKARDRAHDIALDLDPGSQIERLILSDLRSGRLYEPDVSRAICQILRPGDCAIDVGANVGYFTTILASLTGPKGRVLSLEPGQRNLDRLRANIAANRLDNVTVVDQAASDSAGEIDFYVNRDNSAGNAIWDPAQFPGNDLSRQRPEVERIRAVTLDEEIACLGLPTPKLIKIDTEGAEHKVLLGARRRLAGAVVPYVIAELHEFGLNQLGSSQAKLRDFMKSLGYDTFALYFDGSLPKLIPPGVRLTAPFFINLLFSTPQFVAAAWPVERHHPGARPPESRS